MQMEIEVKGQRIKRINSPGSVEDTLNYLTCHFIFSGEEWDNTVKTAYFENPASGKRHPKILADDGTCTVPWEALTDKGFVRFSVAGERDGYRITTGIESFYNSETVYGGEPSEPPTPSQYDQLIALAEQTKEIAESVREDADAGEFDGPPGPQGPKGENGDTGPRGPAGEDGQDATDEQVRGAVDAYMAEHPVQVDTDDLIKIAIKEEASGAVPIVTTDSAEMGVQDLTMQGWTEQNGTPTPEAPVPIVSAGTQNQDTGKWEYEVKLTGANLFNPEKLTGGEIVEYNGVQCYKYTDNLTNFTYIDDFAENTQYCFSVMILSSEGNGEKIVDIKIWYTDGTTTLIKSPHNQLANIVSSANKTVDKITGSDNWSVTRYINLSITTLGIGTEPLPYQPYKEQTVLLTSDRPLTKWDRLEKRNGQWGWVYKSNEIVLDGSENWGVYAAYEGFSVGPIFDTPRTRSEGFSERFICETGSTNLGKYTLLWLGANNRNIYFVKVPQYNEELPDSGLQDWKDWISENPITILTYADEETFVPLSASEREQMNALHTYYPTTILDNDQGCDMALTYIADTKAYIDNKVSAIQAAIVNAI